MDDLPKSFPWRGCEVTGTVMVLGGRRGLHQRNVRVVVDDVDTSTGKTLLMMLYGYKFRGSAYIVTHIVIDSAQPVGDSPHTIGTLLWAVRQRFPGAHTEPNGAAEWDGVNEAEKAHWWAVYAPGGPRLATGPTEFDALVNTLRMMEVGDV